MKNVLFVLLFSIISAGSFGGNGGFNFHLPQSEFKEAGVTTGFGGDFNGMYYIVDQLAFGANKTFSSWYIFIICSGDGIVFEIRSNANLPLHA